MGQLLFKQEEFFKIALAILFSICLFDMPYGYYKIVRFSGLVGFAYLAYKANENKQKELAVVYVGLAILFQPFFKIALGRQIWNVVDVIVSVFLIVTLFMERQKQHK
jgi:hypothetical protein